MVHEMNMMKRTQEIVIGNEYVAPRRDDQFGEVSSIHLTFEEPETSTPANETTTISVNQMVMYFDNITAI